LPIRLIIFDLDGTLVDSILDTTNAVNYAVRTFGLKGLTPSMVAKMLSVTNSAIGVIHKVLKQYNIHGDTNVPVERYLEYYSSHLTDMTVMYPETKETLEALNGYSKAIVTNKPERFAVKILNSLGLYKHFKIIVGGDTVPERKPSPAPIIHILTNLNVKPEDAILVGDGKADIDSGKASNLKTVAATYGYGEAGFEKEADFVIETIPNLLEVVANIV
jgi:phosphoglycolate phosphatase